VVRASDASMPATADSAFRDPLLQAGWSLRGIGKQPRSKSHKSGDPVKKEPDAKPLMLAGGLELLEINAQPQAGLTMQAPSTWGFVRSPADVVFYTGHAVSGNLATHDPHDEWLRPEDLLASWVQTTMFGRILVETDVLIINGCSALLSIYMTRWEKLLSSNQGPLTAVLGYSNTAPPDSGGGEAVARDMAKRMAVLGDKWSEYPRAWMEVNKANYKPEHPWSLLANASALDAAGSWHMSTRPGGGGLEIVEPGFPVWMSQAQAG
jgi:hypothetical protein